jgi:hypothetical protein
MFYFRYLTVNTQYKEAGGGGGGGGGDGDDDDDDDNNNNNNNNNNIEHLACSVAHFFVALGLFLLPVHRH